MLLEISELRAGYGRHQVLTNVTMQVDTGEVVCIIGSNGAGKTTLLRTVCGPVRAKSGRVIFRGRDVTRLPTWRTARLGVGHVPEGRHPFPNLRVVDNLVLGSVAASRRARSASLEVVFDVFPWLAERRWQKVGSLSGGEQQMLAIARALMGSPELVLIDEPSLGLAPRAIDAVFDAIVRMRGANLTTVVVEQNAQLALEISDRAYVLEGGSVVVEGRSSELLRDPRVEQAYLLGRSASESA